MKRYFHLPLLALALISFSFRPLPSPYPSPSMLSKLLAFPVSGFNSKIGSFWGASRDGGERSHKGIDIFARRGTPVVAIADGVIVDKGNTGRGGKVVWLQPDDQPLKAYYAHLDTWKVKKGQRVKKGQVLGTVGNTGNAKTTPAHLHFGIYTKKGAVNPLPYVKKAKKVPVKKK